MNKVALAVAGRAIPVVVAAAASYWPQWIASMQDRGGWWAVGGTLLPLVGVAVYEYVYHPAVNDAK